MVEFGLKLQDNKVKKWSDKYLDYDTLKNLLKKAQNAYKAKNALREKYSEVLDKQGLLVSSWHEIHDNSQDDSNGEKQGLLDKIESPSRSTSPQNGVGYQSMVESNMLNGRPIKHDISSDSLANMSAPGIKRTMSEVSLALMNVFSNKVTLNEDYIKSRYKDLSNTLDARHLEFARCLRSEIMKVDTFYFDEVADIEKRFEYLDSSVAEAAREMSHGTHQSHFVGSDGIRHLNIAGTDSLNADEREKLRKSWNISKAKRRSMASKKSARVVKMLGLVDAASESDNEDNDENELKLKYQSDSIKRSIVDLYRNAKLLKNFASLNYTGFVKIIKKHDKSLPDRKGIFSNIYDKTKFQEGEEIETIIKRMELAYAEWFCDGNINEARARILPKQGDILEMDWSQLRLGYRLGMSAILTVWVCWDCVWGVVRDGNSSIGGREAFPVFRCFGCLVLLHWFWGMSVFIWTRYRINYIYLFEFNPRHVRTPLMIFNDAVDETLVFLVLMLLYYKAGAKDIPDVMPPGMYPFLLVLYALKRLIFPIEVKQRFWTDIKDVLLAPIKPVSFFHSYVADVFTSMVKVFQDMAWTLCFILSGDFLATDENDEVFTKNWQKTIWYHNILIPLICLFPLWIRFFQCLRKYTDTGKRWPNLANATKYALSQTVTLFGAFHPLYLMNYHGNGNEGYLDSNVIVKQSARHIDLFQIFWFSMFIISSLYSYFWDVYMDWGLGRKEYNFLGPQLMFPNRVTYYQVMFLDLFLRSMWVLSLIPPNTGARFEFPNYLTFVTACLELGRRTMWGFFRLENEHKSNTTGYRRVDFVPLHFSTEHEHNYKREKEHRGASVLTEVGLVTLVVTAVCITSIISAQRSNPSGLVFEGL